LRLVYNLGHFSYVTYDYSRNYELFRGYSLMWWFGWKSIGFWSAGLVFWFRTGAVPLSLSYIRII